jgi:tetratricopeptide (TPR) repeat protein
MIARARPRRRSLAALAAAIAVGVVLVLAGALASRLASDGDAAALAGESVVAVLPGSGRIYSDDLRARLRAARASPDDPAAAKAAARQLIDEGRKAGDSRLVGAALGLLRPFLDTPDAEALHLAATAREYQHDFPGALDLLDRALAASPRDAGALLARATINVVLGRLDTADGDCRRLYAAERPDLGFLCQSTTLTLTPEAPAVYTRLEGVLSRTDLLDGSLRSYGLGLLGEIAALQGDRDLARTHLAAALAEEPEALRIRMMLVDLMLAGGDDDALDLLERAPDVDGVLLRRAIAAERLGRVALFDAARTELSRRFRQNLDLGLTAHAREEARFYLEVEHDPPLALARAQLNWDLQHEIEDAQLLIDAATAAGEPAAAAPALRWMEEHGLSVPALRIPDAVRVAAR